ncbi:MAG TPA: hypothetical protein VFE42_20165 [Chloroflexota bacterium]|nr:hypothetical protein [Chloroflexota bacterium]
MVDDARLVRVELTVEEAALLVELLQERMDKDKDDELATTLLARLEQAEDHAVDRVPVRGPDTDGAEYEW